MVLAYVPTARSSLEWAQSKTSGVISEFTLLTPVNPGRIPGEWRTYEERLREYLESLQQRESASIPTFVRPIANIHFARWLILRPEQYLQYSNVPGVKYAEDATPGAPGSLRHTPERMDPYRELGDGPADDGKQPDKGQLRFVSWLLFVVAFDGDLEAYVRHVVATIGEDVDKIWGNCYEYPGTRDFEKFWQYARRHQINTDVFYAAYPTLTVPRIHQLRVFRDKFDDFVSRTRKPDGTSQDGIGALLDEFLRSNLQYPVNFPANGGTYDEAQCQSSEGRLR